MTTTAVRGLFTKNGRAGLLLKLRTRRCLGSENGAAGEMPGGRRAAGPVSQT